MNSVKRDEVSHWQETPRPIKGNSITSIGWVASEFASIIDV